MNGEAILTIAGIILFFLVLNGGVAMWEKRVVWPYGELMRKPAFEDTTGYLARWASDAIAEGFVLLGWAADVRGNRYQLSYGILVSPDGECVAVVSAGKILGIPMQGTKLFSQGTNGRVLFTSEHQNLVEIDISRRWRSQLAKVKTFARLLERHRNLFKKQRLVAESFGTNGDLAVFRAMLSERIEGMHHRGLIAFTDESRTVWRYTFSGAIRLAVLNYTIGMVRALTNGWLPRAA
jgi:hypothetical protein